MSHVDVVIVGAGPAGAAAAVPLAEAGRDVLVIDKARFPRDKCCGDGLTALALRELESLGLDHLDVDSWTRVDAAVIRSPSGRETVFPLPTGVGQYAAVARRADLDHALVRRAVDAGARVADGHGLLGATETSDGVNVDIDRLGTVHADVVIGADGMWSPLRKALGVNDSGYRGEWHAFRQYFVDVGPRARTELIVWFEPDLLPGYAWSFPLSDGVANVGFGIHRGGSHSVRDMAGLWRDLLERPHIRDVLGADARPESPHRAWPIPARVDRSVLATERALFVGDAAAVTDPMTGEGIGQALLTGRLAAEAILARGPAAAAAAYTAEARRDLVADHRMAMALAKLMRSERTARLSIRAAGATAWTRRNFARWMFEDYPRALVATPRRWRRGTLHQPGAYPDQPAPVA